MISGIWASRPLETRLDSAHSPGSRNLGISGGKAVEARVVMLSGFSLATRLLRTLWRIPAFYAARALLAYSIIIRGKTSCSLCGAVLADGEDVVATTHFIADQADPLWRYSDSGMHRECFLAWEHRALFVELPDNG